MCDVSFLTAASINIRIFWDNSLCYWQIVTGKYLLAFRMSFPLHSPGFCLFQEDSSETPENGGGTLSEISINISIRRDVTSQTN